MKFLSVAILLLLCYFPSAGAQTASDTITYTEPTRPQFHFTPKSGWMNDPNGMVYYEGEYHLFYQYYPDSTVWGPMHWGHAITTDLVHWKELPIALYPDSLGYIFSGSAVVDWNNTSGLGEAGSPPMVAIFTHHDMVKERAGAQDVESQSLAYSNDRGRSWMKYDGNPVLPNDEMIRDFRDPKVRWDLDSEQWIMVLAAHDRVLLYGSPDLISWEKLSDFGEGLGSHKGVWECPDLFPLTDERTGEEKWVLLVSVNVGAPNGGSGTQYFIGEFDGREFIIDPVFRDRVTGDRGRWADYGRDNYAGVTFSDIPDDDGRRIFIGWMSNWNYAQVVPTDGWRSAMTVARELTLRQTEGGYVLRMHPVEELALLREEAFAITDQKTLLSSKIDAPAPAPKSSSAYLGEVSLSALFATNDHFGIELYNESGEVLRVGLIGNRNAYYCDRSRAGANTFSDKFAAKISYAPREREERLTNFRLLIDATSIELFADDGEVVLTETFFPTMPFTGIRTYGLEDGSVKVIDSEVYPLASIWDAAKR